MADQMQPVFVVIYSGIDGTRNCYEFEFDYQSEHPSSVMDLFALQLNSLVDVPVIALGIFS